VPSPRPILIYAGVLVVVFAVALAIGYVYNYEPERDLVEVVIDRSALPASDGEFTSGTVVGVSGDVVTIETAQGTLEVPLTDAIVEALRTLNDPAAAPVGVPVNLGGERTATERVISGVVLLRSAATP